MNLEEVLKDITQGNLEALGILYQELRVPVYHMVAFMKSYGGSSINTGFDTERLIYNLKRELHHTTPDSK
ncbi:hypothetical protein [Paenibacillus thermotolerans]|uniref:hypothetical protein n=1 Tax=Paenibacillus thermotolerans TaxID=3027807 RepID=UPI002367E30A|nr:MULTISPECIES: hypothetical protein [unclassified Paenibacillus]